MTFFPYTKSKPVFFFKKTFPTTEQLKKNKQEKPLYLAVLSMKKERKVCLTKMHIHKHEG